MFQVIKLRPVLVFESQRDTSPKKTRWHHLCWRSHVEPRAPMEFSSSGTDADAHLHLEPGADHGGSVPWAVAFPVIHPTTTRWRPGQWQVRVTVVSPVFNLCRFYICLVFADVWNAFAEWNALVSLEALKPQLVGCHVNDLYIDAPFRALVFIAHGAGEHCGRYDDLAQKLTGLNLLVFAHDHGE